MSLFNENVNSKIVVSLQGLYYPPEWENPNHLKKSTAPYVRRIRRKNGSGEIAKNILVIDDRASFEWLEIKRKRAIGEMLSPQEETFLRTQTGYTSSGINFVDGKYSMSTPPINRKYSSSL